MSPAWVLIELINDAWECVWPMRHALVVCKLMLKMGMGAKVMCCVAWKELCREMPLSSSD